MHARINRLLGAAPGHAPGGGLAYHLLVGVIVTACLPMLALRAAGIGADGADAPSLAAAIDAARAAAASAFSLPG